MNTFLCALCAVAISATGAFADELAQWTTVKGESIVAFGSIKNDEFGEVHQFTDVSGIVSEQGELSVQINLDSVETNIDIRNERIAEFVFLGGLTNATLSGQVDMEALNALDVGAVAIVDFEATLTFGSLDANVEAKMLIVRLAEDKVLVTTSDFIMVSTYDLGIDEGIDMLQELAGLDGITRVTPVAVRMMFTKGHTS